MDSRTPRDGRVLDQIGQYHPIEKPENQFTIDSAKVQDWIARGATPSNTVKQLLNRKPAPSRGCGHCRAMAASSREMALPSLAGL